MTDKIKLRKTWFKSTIVITYLANGRINYWGTKQDYDNMPKDLLPTATEFTYIRKNLQDYSLSLHHTVKLKRYYEKDYE